ncbi:MAG: redoxin domain-containing protein [Proteobacteria bacterium]|nr:redoxin domain-containing protein [Pseudomonadota bacterium]
MALWALAMAAGLSAGLGALRADESHERRGPLLPRFAAPLLGGGTGGSDQLIGRRALVWVFSPADPDGERVAAIVRRLAPDARAANIALLGVAVGVDSTQAQRAVEERGIDFPVVLDTRGTVAGKLRAPPRRSSLYSIDAQGFVLGGFRGLQVDRPEYDEAYEAEVRRLLHLTRHGAALRPELGLRPAAPEFRVRGLDGGLLESCDLEGKVGVLMFFSPTCPHCHEALQFFEALLGELDTDELVFAPVSVSDRIYVIEQMVNDLRLEVPLYTDPGGNAARDFTHRFSVPDTIVIDRDGRVLARHQGVNPRIKALLSVQIRAALGVENPIRLSRRGYSGQEFCQACHPGQHSSWELTRHAFAFETLVEHNVDRDPECLPCHTVGWEQPGGYSLENQSEHLRGVQCETCHGRGGPHQSPDFLAETDLESVCLTCHTPEHSLRFVFAERLPLVSHAANSRFAELSLEERIELIERRDKRQRKLFETADYVGSDACASCHPAEHQRWGASAHAGAFETLARQDAQGDPDCQECHTTGFGQPTGWQPGASGLQAVGCESCHGPGATHVAEEGRRPGSILRLTEKCDSCVILQICGSCHDDANDPGFEFELDAKLDLIRHGFRDREAPAP